MEVRISFDTEKESVEDLKRLIVALQDLITRKEKAISLGNPMATSNITRPAQVKVEPIKAEEKKVTPENYTGSGKIIPFEDLSGTVSKIFSNGRL